MKTIYHQFFSLIQLQCTTIEAMQLNIFIKCLSISSNHSITHSLQPSLTYPEFLSPSICYSNPQVSVPYFNLQLYPFWHHLKQCIPQLYSYLRYFSQIQLTLKASQEFQSNMHSPFKILLYASSSTSYLFLSKELFYQKR